MEIGTRIVFKYPEGDDIKGEVVDMNDPRFKGKIAHSFDICVLWENGQKITYDKEFFKNELIEVVETQEQEEG